MDNSRYEIYQRLHPEKAVFLVRDIETNEFFVKKIYKYHEGMVYERLLGQQFEGIPRVLHFNKINNDQVCVIEEYIKGTNFDDYIAQNGALTENEALQLGVKLCELIGHLHQLEPPIIHRDIKPSNILLSDDGKIWLIDFNAAKEFHDEKTSDTYYIGTKDFAAPEQFGFGTSDVRTDIYGIGKTLQFFLNGQKSKELPEGTSSNLRRAIIKSTETDPKRRYSNVSQLRRELTNKNRLAWLWSIPAFICVLLLIIGIAILPGKTLAPNSTEKVMQQEAQSSTATITDGSTQSPTQAIADQSTQSLTQATTQGSTQATTPNVTQAATSKHPDYNKTLHFIDESQNDIFSGPSGFVYTIGVTFFGNDDNLLCRDIEYSINTDAFSVYWIPGSNSATMHLQFLPKRNYTGDISITLYRCGTTAGNRTADDEITITHQVDITGITCNHEWDPATCRRPAICKVCGIYDGQLAEPCYEKREGYPNYMNCIFCGTDHNHDELTVDSISYTYNGEPVTQKLSNAASSVTFNYNDASDMLVTVNFASPSYYPNLQNAREYAYIKNNSQYPVYYVSSTNNSCTFRLSRYRATYYIQTGCFLSMLGKISTKLTT